jgi:predicted enzyme related to lactoylglutathione lyase
MSKRSVVHVEIPASSREESATFYKELCGWEYQHMTEPAPYTLFEGGNTGGGFADVNDSIHKVGHVLVYLSSDDIDADLKRVEALGGKTLMPKTSLGPNGWIGMFSDPTGNTLAFWSSNG